ncbi:putative E3 ubiquitin-protein ligase XERICO [Iris pallida]|uniref:E3 ubiquitin-protein ligase XERICO n=1 Tax=Iris pallida TaxID=29817 RepID=A0AAX6EG30_IRIPA|nr:putative E3 ubiquitin-protein ligase XERICO [Iris pallida]
MGLSSMPTASEGVLTVVLVNTALSVSIVVEIFRSLLGLLGLRHYPPSDTGSDCPPETTKVTERFRSRFKPVRFGLIRLEDCRVCLNRFEPESMVCRLTCGHVFHRGCVETWLEYNQSTCPLCRCRFFADEPEPVGSGSVWF